MTISFKKFEKFVDLTLIGSAIRLRFLQRSWTNPRTIVHVNLRHSWLMFIDISCIFRRVVINNPTFFEKSSWTYRSKAREFVFETAYTSKRRIDDCCIFFFSQRNAWKMLFSSLTSELNNLIVTGINFLKRSILFWTMTHLMLLLCVDWSFPLSVMMSAWYL